MTDTDYYLACGCHCSQRDHTCADIEFVNGLNEGYEEVDCEREFLDDTQQFRGI